MPEVIDVVDLGITVGTTAGVDAAAAEVEVAGVPASCDLSALLLSEPSTRALSATSAAIVVVILCVGLL